MSANVNFGHRIFGRTCPSEPSPVLLPGRYLPLWFRHSGSGAVGGYPHLHYTPIYIRAPQFLLFFSRMLTATHFHIATVTTTTTAITTTNNNNEQGQKGTLKNKISNSKKAHCVCCAPFTPRLPPKIHTKMQNLGPKRGRDFLAPVFSDFSALSHWIGEHVG